MDSVLVIGAGFMGGGIAQVAAQAGYKVYLQDASTEAADKTIQQIKWSTDKLASKGLIKDSAKAVQDRISVVNDLAVAAKCQWVIEAVFEDEALKKGIFKELDGLCQPSTVLATNTSCIPITRIATATRHPERVVGIHFFGPVPLMVLVEVVKGEKTSDDTLEKAVEFVKSLNHYPVRVHKDIPRFVMNRINSMAFKEALDLVRRGIATVEDIDKGMRYGFGWKIGPFEIADNSGLDTYLRVGKTFETLEEVDDKTLLPIIEKMVKAGRLGRKVGKGFYDYLPDGTTVPFDIRTLK